MATIQRWILAYLFIAVESWAPITCQQISRLQEFITSSDIGLSAQKRAIIPTGECLVPEPNPNSDPNAKSLSGVPLSHVTRGIDALYPPQELEKRNAQSRTDGYWKYVSRGEEPPKEFTYGEFDVEFFGELLDTAWEYFTESEEQSDDASSVAWKDKVFCDIGSGTGRLVLSAAALHPNWKLCRGLEILQKIHDISVQILDDCELSADGSDSSLTKYCLRVPMANETSTCWKKEQILPLPLAQIQYTCGSFLNAYEYLGDIDCAFVFSSCMKPSLVKDLSIAIGRQLRPGSIIITTEFPLVLRGHIDPLKDDKSMPHGNYEIELLEKVDGWCWLMGGESTAYIHRVKTSLWKEYAGPRNKPQLSLEDEMYQLVQLMRSDQLTDPDAFWRDVCNELSFRGISPDGLSSEELLNELLKL